jgi:hypothetical protein
VIGVDEFALCRRHRYAMIITDAETGRRVAVLPDPARAVLQSWLRTSWCRGRVPRRLGHLRRGNPPCPARRGAGQRPTAPLESPLRQSPTRVRAHTGYWVTVNPPRPNGVREYSTRERWKRSTTSSARASASSTGPAAWTWP